MRYTVHKCDVCERDISDESIPIKAKIGRLFRGYVKTGLARYREFDICDICWVEFVLFVKSKLEEDKNGK